MNELSYDQLLKIEPNHPISCPDINALKFCGGMSTRAYEVSLNYDPSDLIVDMSSLIKTTESLDSWANGVLNTVVNLPEDLTDCFYFSEDEIEDLLLYRGLEDLKAQALDINETIAWWQRSIDSINKKNIEFKSKIKEIEEIEKELLLVSLSDRSLLDKKRVLINSKYEESKYIEHDIELLRFSFDTQLTKFFEIEVGLFSYGLELLRERNDNLRVKVSSLKRDLIDNAKEYLDLYMPTEYLDMRFDEDSNKEINIGVLFNDVEIEGRTPESNFFNTIKRVGDKAGLNFYEKERLLSLYDDKTKSKIEIAKEITKTLKDKGFDKVRYYINSEDYLENRSNFIEEKLNLKNFKKIKI